MSTQPDYTRFEPNAREELLSQIGGFSAQERSTFHRLCESWAPVIDHARFVARLGGSEQDASTVDRLMKKLRTAELGLMTTTVMNDKRVPAGIVLTSRGDLTFYVTLVEEETRKLTDSGYRVLPSAARLSRHGVVPPDYHITDANPTALVEAYVSESHEESILRVHLLEEYEVLTTGRTVKELIAASVRWLRANLEERGFVDEIARTKNTSIMDIRQRLADRAPHLWLDLTRTIVEERNAIATRKNITENDEIFQAALLLMNFMEARMGAALERKADDSKIEQELATLAGAVAESPSGRMDADQFNHIASEAEHRLGHAAGAFRGRLASTLMTPRPRRKLPVVSALAGEYVHRDNLRAVFESARVQCAERLREHYLAVMEDFLRGRAPEAGETFAARANLDHEIRERVEGLDPLVGELLSRPQLLAEALIREVKLREEEITSDELKQKLGIYFNVKNSELLPPSEIFDLNLVSIFDEAFARVGVFRQLILRLSSRHDSLRRNYVRRFGAGGSRLSFADDGDAGAPTGGRTRTEPQPAPGIRVQGTGPRGQKSTDPETGRRRIISPRTVKPRVRSLREVERAWQDFGDALQSKPKDSEDEPS